MTISTGHIIKFYVNTTGTQTRTVHRNPRVFAYSCIVPISDLCNAPTKQQLARDRKIVIIPTTNQGLSLVNKHSTLSRASI